jgi:hypothetical protein
VVTKFVVRSHLFAIQLKSLRRNLAALAIVNGLVAIGAIIGLGWGQFSSLAISNAKKFNELAVVLKARPAARTAEIFASDAQMSNMFSIALAKVVEHTLGVYIVLAALNAVTLTIVWLQSRKFVAGHRDEA